MMTFLPKTLENRAALRTALSAVIAILLAFALHLEKPYWSGMTVVILANIFTGNILDKAILRLIGTIIGAWLGYFLAGFVVDSLFLYLALNFFIITIAVYYFNFSRYAYAYLMMAISAFIVIAELAISPHDAFLIAVWRPVEIGLGVLVSAASAFCLFPNTIQDSVTAEVNTIFDLMNTLLTHIIHWINEPNETNYDIVIAHNFLLKKQIRKAIEMINFMRHEVGYNRNKIDQFRFLLDSFINFTRTITYFMSASTVKKGDKLLEKNTLINHFFILIQQDIKLLKTAFSAKEEPEELQTSLVMAHLDDELRSLMNEAVPQKNYLSLFYFLRQINSLFINLKWILLTGKTESYTKKVITTEQPLRHDPDIFIHSIKAGLTAILALSFWLLSNWPGGLNGIVSSIMISVQKNLYEMKNIGIYRFIGCLAGGSIFLVSTLFFSMNLYLFIVITFVSVWAFSLFSFKNADYAYIGLQANIALIIAMAQEGGPPMQIAAPLERLGGVMIGIIASFIVANLLWRTDLLTMLKRQLHKLQFYLTRNTLGLINSLDDQTVLYDVSNAFWVCRGLTEALEKEHLNRLNRFRFARAKKLRESLVFLQAINTNIYCNIDQESAQKTAQKYHIDLFTIEQAITHLFQKKGQGNSLAIKTNIDKALAQLLKNFSESDTPLTEIENCAAYLHALQQLTQVNEQNKERGFA